MTCCTARSATAGTGSWAKRTSPADLACARSSEREERADALEDAVALAGLAGALAAGVEALARGDQFDAAARELVRQLGGDVGAGEQHGLERLLAEPEALDIAERDHVGGARLAGHQAHLAEEVGRADRGDHDLGA